MGKGVPGVTVYEYDDLPEPDFNGIYRTLEDSMVSYMERRVRLTIEYRQFFQYMKKTLKVSNCSFYKDYSMEKGFTIELHHNPLTLWEIVKIVANKHYAMNKDDPQYEPWRVEEEVNKLHYAFKVGLTPLNPTAHALVHSGKLTIHPTMVNGNWDGMAREYWEYMDDNTRKKIDDFRELAKKPIDGVPSILKYKPVLISNVKFRSLGSNFIEEFILDRLKKQMIEGK